MSSKRRSAMRDLEQAGAENRADVARVYAIANDVVDTQLLKYKKHLNNVMLALLNLHGAAVEIVQKGGSAGDTELGELGVTFINHLNKRRLVMLASASEKMVEDEEVIKIESSICVLVAQLREKFGIHWPELWA